MREALATGAEQGVRTPFTVPVPAAAAAAFYVAAAVFVAVVAVSHVRGPGIGFIGLAAVLAQVAFCVWLFRSFGNADGFFHPAAFHGLFTLLLLARELPLYGGVGVRHDVIQPGSRELLAAVIAEYAVLGAIGLGAYAAVFAVWRRRPLFARPGRSLQLSALFAGDGPAARATFLALAFAALVMADLILRKGGLEQFLLGWGLGRRTFLAGSFYIVPIVHLPAMGTVIWGMRPASWRQLRLWLAITAVVPLLFLSTGSRGDLLAYGFMLFGAYTIGSQRLSVGKGAALVVAALVVFAAVGDFRSSLFSRDRIEWTWRTDEMMTGFQNEFLSRANTRSGALPIIAYVPWSEPRLHGGSAVALATLPVPRTLWPDKPGLIDGRVGNTFFGYNVGIPAGTVGEAYWNFGTLGVVLGFALLALLHAAFYQFAITRGHVGAAAVYLAALWTLRIPGTSALTALLLWVVPGVIMVVAARGSVRPAPSAAAAVG